MSTTATTHGMDRTRVAPDWAPLNLDEVRALLNQFDGCEEPFGILSVSPRPFSAASLVGTRHGRVFVKRHHRSVRDREGLREEHCLLEYLHAHAGRVPRVLANTSGETVVEMGEWTFEVHEATAGVDIYQDALSWTPFLSSYHAFSAGKALAELHCAAKGFIAPLRKARPLVAGFTIFATSDPAAAMERYLKDRPALSADAETLARCAEALDLLAAFHARLSPLLPDLAPLWTHNDLHASNLLWNNASLGARVNQIIDFGLSDRTNAVHDIAHMIERNIVEWLELNPASAACDNVPIHLDHLESMLDGYQSVRRLSDAEAAALAPMTALCHAEFALSEADYFLGILHSETNARLWQGRLSGRTLLVVSRPRWAEAVGRD